MIPSIQLLPAKKVAGIHLSMSFADNRTVELWRSFMPRRKELTNTVGSDLISMQVYPAEFDFAKVDINTKFTKWACAEVADFSAIPEGMTAFEIPEGLYAVFHYKGNPADGQNVFQYIFGEWLPASGYSIDQRPHFEVLGPNYKNNDPESEEEIWIPVK